MTDLYVAFRSDNSSILKVGRSRDPARRCGELQSSHCFEMRLLAVFPGAGSVETEVHRALESMREPGPGREWFHASPMEVYSAIALAMRRKRPRPPSPERIEYMARDLLTRLESVQGPTAASRKEAIDQFASRLYGVHGSEVIARAGLEHYRTTIGGRADRSNEYVYAKARAGGGRSYVRISANPRAVGGGAHEKGALRGDDSSGSEGVAASGSVASPPP